MAYITKDSVQKCLDDLSGENLIGNENDTFISLAEAKDRIEELPTADVVERSLFENLIDNAMSIPKPMHLYIYFADEHVEKHMVTRFTDLSQTKSQFYYYEEPHHESGKGKTFRRDEIKCFEVSFCPLQNWEQHLTVKEHEN